MFEGEVRELYETISAAQDSYQTDLNSTEIYELWCKDNPTSTLAEKDTIKILLENIDNQVETNDSITTDLISSLYQREIGRKVATYGLLISEGDTTAIERLDALLESVDVHSLYSDEFGEATSKDVEDLLETANSTYKWKFNIKPLRDKLEGIGEENFAVVFARPETGKTAFAVSLACSEGGFCSQGAKVLYLGNEESTNRTMLRAVTSYCDLTKEEFLFDPEIANEKFAEIKPNIDMKDIQDWDIGKVERYIHFMQPDIVLVDQADKIGLNEKMEADHLKLRKIYTTLREIAKRQKVAMFAFSQASADAEGRTTLLPAMMEGSKTGKFAEADLIIGIGKYPDNEDGSIDPLRFLTLGKNKINSWHGTITCKLDIMKSTYKG